MRKRRKMKKKASRKHFKKGMKTHVKNVRPYTTRGGIRL